MYTKHIKKRLEEQNSLGEIVDILYQEFPHYDWVGIYRVVGNELILEAWKGPEATQHVRIPIGKGICGSAARSGQTEVVQNVSHDPRYLACFLSTCSEIVVPIKKGDKVLGEIDIDSDKENAFTEEDRIYLEEVASLIAKKWDDFRPSFNAALGGTHDGG